MRRTVFKEGIFYFDGARLTTDINPFKLTYGKKNIRFQDSEDGFCVMPFNDVAKRNITVIGDTDFEPSLHFNANSLYAIGFYPVKEYGSRYEKAKKALIKDLGQPDLTEDSGLLVWKRNWGIISTSPLDGYILVLLPSEEERRE